MRSRTTLPLQAVVAGNAAVLPLLSCMRIAFKGALTEMHNGLRLSVNLYFATATIVVLIAGAVYMIVVRPAVAAVMMDVDDQQLPCFCKQVSVSGKSLQPSTIKSTKSAVLSRARQPSPDFADVELQRTVSKKRLKLPQALMRHQSDCIIKRNKLEDTIQDWSGHDAIIVLQGQVWLSSTGSLNSSIHHHQQLHHRDCPSIILQFATPAPPPLHTYTHQPTNTCARRVRKLPCSSADVRSTGPTARLACPCACMTARPPPYTSDPDQGGGPIGAPLLYAWAVCMAQQCPDAAR